MIVIIRGGGETGSGVALRLHRAGFRVAISELEKPFALRRMVSFADAINSKEITVEGVTGKKLNDPTDSFRVLQVFSKGLIPVMVDSQGDAIQYLHPTVVVDARMLNKNVELDTRRVTLLIGLGSGFEVNKNCHAVIETRCGHGLGRVYWQGNIDLEPDNLDDEYDCPVECLVPAPADGILETHLLIGSRVEAQQTIANVGGQAIESPFAGLLRGLLLEGLQVHKGQIIAEIAPYDDARVCSLVSDRALAIGGGVLEAILTKAELRPHLWK
ncbi:MAG: EF2563 family selenium-dependent molybdenum hydroxylase system protein [Anaerolineales bacterium]|nr:EF2563 family selenium-dependent molybdenum hydroxylase system protein [Anaerolineales bacterium]